MIYSLLFRKLQIFPLRTDCLPLCDEQALKSDLICDFWYCILELRICFYTVFTIIKTTCWRISLSSKVVYTIECLCCNACYVGQTSRHLLCRVKGHKLWSSPVRSHFASSDTSKFHCHNVFITKISWFQFISLLTAISIWSILLKSIHIVQLRQKMGWPY